MLPFNKGNRILSVLLKKERIPNNKAAIKFYNSYLLPFVLLTMAFGLLTYHGAGYNSVANVFELTTFATVFFSFFLLFKLYHADRKRQVADSKSVVNELRFEKIYNSGMIALLIADMDGNVKQANDAFLAMVGYTQSDLEEGLINWRELSAPEYQEVTERAIKQLKETGTCEPFEKEYICKNGGKINVLLGSAMLSKEGGHEIVGYALNISARKAAEKREKAISEQLIQQQDEMLRVFISAPASILIRRGPELKLTFANKSALSQMSKDNPAIVGKTMEESLELMNTTFDPGIFKQVYESGNPYTGKSFHMRHDRYGSGEQVDAWYDFVLEPFFDETGKVDGVVTFSFEVTELVKANRDLKLSDDRFRFITDATPHKLWTSGPDGKATYYNKGWYDYIGATDFEQLKAEIWNAIHPGDLERSTKLWAEAIENKEDLELEQRLRRYDGVYLWHLTRVCVCKDEKGEVIMWVGSSTNIQEQKCAQDALKASEAHFKALANTNSLLIWQTDAECRTTYVNDTWRAYTGITEEDAIDEDSWLNNIHPDDREIAAREFNTAFEQHVVVHSKYRFMDKRSGQFRWMLDNAHPVFNPKFEGYIGSMTDIHEQEMAQIATRLLMQKKDEFLGIATHELKTPITSMKASLQILENTFKQEDANIEKVVPIVTLANKQVKKLTNIVDDLLDVTKIQSGKMQLNITTYNFNDSLQDCVQEIQQQTAKHELVIERASTVHITADRTRMEQVIINLLSNAVKYSPNHRLIAISVTEDNKELRFSVTDRGIGIPVDKQEYIFDRFFRVHESSQMFSGLGLGLFISSEIIKQHGGSMGLESEEGKGSTFWFTLPILKM